MKSVLRDNIQNQRNSMSTLKKLDKNTMCLIIHASSHVCYLIMEIKIKILFEEASCLLVIISSFFNFENNITQELILSQIIHLCEFFQISESVFIYRFINCIPSAFL